jgi:hypothetical protein
VPDLSTTNCYLEYKSYTISNYPTYTGYLATAYSSVYLRTCLLQCRSGEEGVDDLAGSGDIPNLRPEESRRDEATRTGYRRYVRAEEAMSSHAIDLACVDEYLEVLRREGRKQPDPSA